MAAQTAPYADLLSAYKDAEPLPDTFNADGKSLYNPPGPRSSAYDEFPAPIDSSNNGFDFHIYYMQAIDSQKEYARALHERIRREFPELRIYRFWEKPVGPHPVAMFEVNTFTPHQTGTLISWLVVHRGPCSVLVHPNTGDAYADHTELATWIGKPWPLHVDILKREARFGPNAQRPVQNGQNQSQQP
ncbi:hypothetical protein ACEPAG_4403 [Sanghuangporus baumii]